MRPLNGPGALKKSQLCFKTAFWTNSWAYKELFVGYVSSRPGMFTALRCVRRHPVTATKPHIILWKNNCYHTHQRTLQTHCSSPLGQNLLLRSSWWEFEPSDGHIQPLLKQSAFLLALVLVWLSHQVPGPRGNGLDGHRWQIQGPLLIKWSLLVRIQAFVWNSEENLHESRWWTGRTL